MSLYPRRKAVLALADGTIEEGWSVGHVGTTGGELCFNTTMYDTRKSHRPQLYGQLMMMTYPHIGNYGTSARDDEAAHVMISGMIVRAFSWEYSNPMADGSLNDYLMRHHVVGISGVDTRRLVRHIRSKGVMNAVISSENLNHDELVEQARNWVSMEGLELASKVTRDEAQNVPGQGAHRIAAFDYGIKQNIINSLNQRGITLRIFPARASFEEVMDWNPDGFFFSNGPGDPNPMDYAIETVNKAKATGKPMFGICLGHQVMALSEGVKVDKMFVGHRGANHPVKNNRTGLVEITTQNHGFAIDPKSVDSSVAEITHINLNDHTVEGLDFKNFNGFSVQYHPEASPGPHDSQYLFDEFLSRIESSKS